MDHDVTRRAGTGYITETPDGLLCRGVLIMDSPVGQQAYAEVKHYQLHGPPMALSIGYQTRKDRWQGGRRYIITEGELWEGSLVSFGMNPQAFVTQVKRETPGRDGTLTPLQALVADMTAWLEQRKAKPSLEDQVRALNADIRRWLRRHQRLVGREDHKPRHSSLSARGE